MSSCIRLNRSSCCAGSLESDSRAWSIELLTKVDTPASGYHENAHALRPDLLNSSFWLSAASQPSLTISEADSAHLSIQR